MLFILQEQIIMYFPVLCRFHKAGNIFNCQPIRDNTTEIRLYVMASALRDTIVVKVIALCFHQGVSFGLTLSPIYEKQDQFLISAEKCMGGNPCFRE